MGISLFEYAARLKCAKHCITHNIGIDRHTKEHTGRRRAYNPYLSLSGLPPSCDEG
jgi:hypothetical protein